MRSTTTEKFGSSKLDWCLVLIFIALLPLLSMHAQQLWQRPHFQFFPLAWLAFASIVMQRANIRNATKSVRIAGGTFAWVCTSLLAICASLYFSRWLAMLSMISAILAWAVVRLADTPFTRLLSWLGLLLVTLPLPGALDSAFIHQLQGISAQSASALLDITGTAHLKQGNIIHVAPKQLFVDEACSGVDSFYALLAISVLIVVWQQKPLLVGALTIVSVPAWAWMGNVLRLFLIAFLLDTGAVDLSRGWKHTTLGLFTFAFSSAGLVLTTDFFGNLFKSFSLNSIPREREGCHLVYNFVTSLPEAMAWWSEAGLVGSESQKQAGAGESPLVYRRDQAIESCIKALPAIVFIVCCFVAYKSFARPSGASLDVIALPNISLTDVEKAFLPDSFPKSVAGASFTEFAIQQRDTTSFEGQYSATWKYASADGLLTLSIDFPFLGFHDLWVCYEMTGKAVVREPQFYALAETGRAIAQVELMDEFSARSYLWFALFDESGSTTELEDRKTSLASEITRRITSGASQRTTYQVQLYVQPSQELSPSELTTYLELFKANLPNSTAGIRRLRHFRSESPLP